MKTYKLFINNKWIDAEKKETFDVINPFNSRVIAKVAKGTRNDAKKAIDAARKSFDSGIWSSTSPSARSSVLWKLADLVEKNAERLAKIESEQTGKTIKYAKDSDIPFIIDNLRFFANASRILEGFSSGEYATYEHKGKPMPLGTSIIRREPIGVIGAIVPWNYPLFIAVWKIGPALAAGNSIVIKPASYTPLSLLEFAKLTEEAGLPAGVLNVITGPGEIVGEELATNERVDMIALTGDTSTGKRIMQCASSTVKKMHLELGGKAPLIVLEDADFEAVAQGAVVGATWNTGQDCTAVTRVYVPEKLHDTLVKRMAQIMKQIILGNPAHKNTDMGPLISAKHQERVENYIKLGIKEGAKVICGGKRPKGKLFEDGFFIQPTILTNVKHHATVCQEEIFGPVISVFKYKTVEEAIQKSNDVKYGLAASVWGKDISKLMKIANKLQFGTVWINEHGVLVSEMPHGGYKQSGFGKDLSMYSFDEFTKIKHVYIDLTEMQRKPWHYVVYGEQ